MSAPRATSSPSDTVITWIVVLGGSLMVAAVLGYSFSMVYAMTLWS